MTASSPVFHPSSRWVALAGPASFFHSFRSGSEALAQVFRTCADWVVAEGATPPAVWKVWRAAAAALRRWVPRRFLAATDWQARNRTTTAGGDRRSRGAVDAGAQTTFQPPETPCRPRAGTLGFHLPKSCQGTDCPDLWRAPDDMPLLRLVITTGAFPSGGMGALAAPYSAPMPNAPRATPFRVDFVFDPGRTGV